MNKECVEFMSGVLSKIKDTFSCDAYAYVDKDTEGNIKVIWASIDNFEIYKNSQDFKSITESAKEEVSRNWNIRLVFCYQKFTDKIKDKYAQTSSLILPNK